MSINISKIVLISFVSLLAVVILISAGIYAWQKNYSQQVACTKEAKQCPDGSAVGRTGPNCEFAKCSSGMKETIKYTGNPAYSDWTEEQIKNDCRSKGGNFNPCASSCEDPSGPCIQLCIQECTFGNSGGDIFAGPTSTPKDWKTYRNEKYGFEFRYPTKLNIEDIEKNPAGLNLSDRDILIQFLILHNPHRLAVPDFIVSMLDPSLNPIYGDPQYLQAVKSKLTHRLLSNGVHYWDNGLQPALGGFEAGFYLTKSENAQTVIAVGFTVVTSDETLAELQYKDVVKILSTFKFTK